MVVKKLADQAKSAGQTGSFPQADIKDACGCNGDACDMETSMGSCHTNRHFNEVLLKTRLVYHQILL